MEFWTLIEKVRDLINTAPSIEDWCMVHYDRHHKIYLGYDEENPPPEEDYPIVVISPVEQTRSTRIDYGDMVLQVAYGLHDESKTTLGNVITYDGVTNIFDFRITVEAELFGANVDFGGAWIESADEFIEPVEMFPFFISIVDYKFKNPDRFNPILPTGS